MPSGMTTTFTKKKRILFVDDDTAFIQAMSELFVVKSTGAWQVMTATTAAHALGILQEHLVDLAVLDINMPVVDGLQLLRLLHQKYPQLKKVVLTGYADEVRRTECLSSGAELFIEKPRTSEGFESVFATLNELIVWKPQGGFRGMLRQVGLQDVVQLECLGRNSSILEVFNTQMRGRVYIEEGAIVHAAAGAIRGELALQAILALAEGEFSLKPFEPPPERTIIGQWEALLMEAARVRDELPPPGELTYGDALAVEVESAIVSAEAARKVASPTNTRIEEVVICSGQGAVLYEWQCKDIGARLKLFQHLAQQAGRLNQLLPFGRFDRLELNNPPERVVALVQSDRSVWIRSTRDGSQPGDATS